MTETSTSEPMTHAQVLAAIQTLFPHAEIRGDDNGNDGSWVIETNVPILNDMSVFDGTPAGEAYATPYPCDGGTLLDNWAEHNGHYWSTLHDAAVAYNKEYGIQRKIDSRLREKLVAMGQQAVIDNIVDRIHLPNSTFESTEAKIYMDTKKEAETEVRREVYQR